MNKTLLLATAVLGLSFGGFAAITDGEGRPFREIVIAADAPGSVKLAANELRDLAVAIGQQELPVVTAPTGEKPVIYVGEHPDLAAFGIDPTALPSDGFVIKSVPDALVIAGKDYHGQPLFGPINPWRPVELYNNELQNSALMEQGTLFGVYAFLEDFGGVRFYLPLDIGTVADPVDGIRVDAADIRRAPRFNYRYPWYSFHINDRDGALWFHRAGFGGKAPVMIIHTYDWMKKYQETNPEFWALADGERAFTNQCVADGKGHLCLNNPGLIARWTQDIIEFFDANPEFEVYPLAPNDGLSRICECPDCQADLDPAITGTGQFSYHIWKFVDRIARGVAAKHPDKYIGCIAYEKYREPPQNLELSPNVAVMFCYPRSEMVDPVFRAKIHEEVAAWSQAAGRMYYWVWYLTHWAPTDYLPILYSEAIGAEIKRMADNPKFMGEFIESENRADKFSFGHDRMGIPGMEHLNLYVTGRLYWNPEADVKAILDEYYHKFYGPAEAPMRDFWSFAEERRNAVMATNPGVSPDVLFDSATLARLNADLAEAQKLAPADSVYAARVKLIADEFAVGAGRLTRLLQQGVSKADVPAIAGPDAVTTMRPQRFMSVAAEAVTPATQIYFGYDRTNLYIRILCFEPEMDKLVSNASGPDAMGIWNDDCVEIFLGPDESDLTNFYQLIVNADGALWDGRIDRPNHADTSWDSKAQVKVTREAKRWVADLTIPFTSIGIHDPNFAGDIVANFYRMRVAGDRPMRSMWSPTGKDGNFEPADFGRLHLKK